MDNLKWHPPGKTPPVGIPLWLHTYVEGERPYVEAVREQWAETLDDDWVFETGKGQIVGRFWWAIK